MMLRAGAIFAISIAGCTALAAQERGPHGIWLRMMAMLA